MTLARHAHGGMTGWRLKKVTKSGEPSGTKLRRSDTDPCERATLGIAGGRHVLAYHTRTYASSAAKGSSTLRPRLSFACKSAATPSRLSCQLARGSGINSSVHQLSGRGGKPKQLAETEKSKKHKSVWVV